MIIIYLNSSCVYDAEYPLKWASYLWSIHLFVLFSIPLNLSSSPTINISLISYLVNFNEIKSSLIISPMNWIWSRSRHPEEWIQQSSLFIIRSINNFQFFFKVSIESFFYQPMTDIEHLLLSIFIIHIHWHIF